MMISFLRSTTAQQMAARRNCGVNERRVRLMQLGERAYLCRVLESHHDDDDDKDDNNRNTLCLVDFAEVELRRYLTEANRSPTKADVARALEHFAAQVQAGNHCNIRRLEISKRIQELLEETNRQAFLSILTGLVDLREVILGKVTMEILSSLEPSAPTLECLSMEGLHVETRVEQGSMADLLSNFTSLKRLDWKTSSYRRATQIQVIGRTVPALSNLQCLRLAHAGLKEFHPCEALKLVNDCPSLQEFVLNNWKLPATAGTILADGIARHPNLQRLELSRCEISEEGWDGLMTSLQENGVLLEFSFPETRILRVSGGLYPSRVVWERFVVLLQDYNHTLRKIENVNSFRVWRLLELNRSYFRQQLDDVKLAPLLLAMASHSPRFLYSMLHKNVETLMVRKNQEQTTRPPSAVCSN